MDPLLHDFLTHASDEEDAEWLEAIRHAYLPDVIIAYNTVLHFAGTYLGRDHFTKSLELATLLASEENKELTDALVATGRMGELVTGLGLTSKALLKWNEQAGRDEGRAKKRKVSRDMGRKRGWDGRTLEIWDLAKVN